jgi:hypothetical protein
MPDYDSAQIPRQVWGYYHPFYGSPDGPTGNNNTRRFRLQLPAR